VSGHDHSGHEHRSRANWWISAGATALVYAAGVHGFLLYARAYGEISISDSFYFAFQLFLVHPTHLEHPINGWIEGARWAALALDTFAAFAVGRRMFAQEIARARLRRARNHFVVIARPLDARAIAAAIRRRHPTPVVAILETPQRPGGLIEKIARHTYVVPGDVRSTAPAVRLHDAAEAIVAGPDDGENLAAAAEITTIANLHRESDEPLVCQVQIQSVGVRETLRRASSAEGARAYARSFDHFERAVTRLLARDLPLDGAGIGAADPTTVHVVIIGHGDWALAAATAAVRLGHFANGRPLRLSVITGDAGDWLTRVAGTFDAVGELLRHEVRTSGPETHAGAEWLRAAARAEHTRLAVVIAPMHDAAAVEIEAGVRDAVRGTNAGVAVRLQHGGLSALLREGGALAGVDVVPFGWLDDRAWAALLEDDEREHMAKLVQVRFSELAHAHGRSESIDKAVAEWRTLSREDYKESNRQQVDHLWLKLRAVGCEIAGASDARPAAVWSPEEIEVLSEMEHRRWVAERRLSGWRLAPGNKNEVERTTPYLVSWSDLAEDIKDYDRSAVLNIADLVRATGNRKICRR
jgi:hypothetical protein